MTVWLRGKIRYPLHEELSQLAREFMIPLREALTA
jgi:hypothetical protein